MGKLNGVRGLDNLAETHMDTGSETLWDTVNQAQDWNRDSGAVRWK